MPPSDLIYTLGVRRRRAPKKLLKIDPRSGCTPKPPSGMASRRSAACCAAFSTHSSYIVMAYIVIAYIVLSYIVMAYIVIVYIVMA